MSKPIKLKSCPFCGGERVEYEPTRDSVYCLDCEALGPAYSSKDDAIAAWNRRGTKSDK